LKAENAINSLVNALGDDDDDVKEAAAIAIGKLKSEKALPALESLC